MPPVQLILPRFLVPVRPRGQVLEGHALAIEGDRIVSIAPATASRAAYPEADVVALDDHVLLPGLINMHTHSPMSLLRGYADDIELYDWLRSHIWPAERRFLDSEFVADGSRLAMAEMIRAGTTCFNENYFFPDAIAKVTLEVGLRAAIGIPLLDQASRWAQDFDEYLAKGLETKAAFQEDPLLSFTLAPHAPYSVDDDGLGQIARTSQDHGLRVHLHCLETAFDLEHSRANHGLDPLDRLEQHDLLNENLLAVHMTQLGEQDFEQLASHGVHVVHCPQSNLKLASGICPVAALVNAGVNVCLGTDGAASNNNLDLLEEARFAALLAKGASGDATVLDAVTTMEMLTINGAAALGLDDRIGSLEVGKMADLCAMNLAEPQTQPLHDHVISQIVYAASSSQFTDVWVGGRRIMNDRELKTVDESAVLASAGAWGVRLNAAPASHEVAW